MARLILGMVILLGSLSPAGASLAPRKEPRRPDHRLPAQVLNPAARPGRVAAKVTEAPEEFSLSEQTEVKLNGKPCRYADVPDDARVIYMEVTPDRKHILRVHFKSGGK